MDREMTTRILPPEEWERLSGTELGEVWPILPPACTKVLVVEDTDGRIIGCWALMNLYHAEGLWIAPDHRGKGSVARRLIRDMSKELRELGATTVITAAIDPAIVGYLERMGAEALPASYAMPVRGGS
jgi:N-acetylglutamate synthase-like GNAT family acetyltransferase